MRRLLVLAMLASAAAVACCAPAEAQTDDPGYVRQFLAAGNWRHVDTGRQLLKADDLPFEGRMTVGKLWTVVTAREDGFVDLNVLGPTSPETALVHLYVASDAERTYRLMLGSDDRAHVTLNGRPIHSSGKSGPWKPDQEQVELPLAAGWNRLLLRVESDGAAFGFSLRFALPDGRPVQLKTSTAVPEAWLERPQLKQPLSEEGVNELLELLSAQIGSVARLAEKQAQAWNTEGECLDGSYAEAREQAVDYVETLRRVLETLPAVEGEKEEAERRLRSEAARKDLQKSAVRGPTQLMDRTRAFIERSERGGRLWEMVRFAASTTLEAGRQTAEVDRALVEARGLIAAVSSEYLRPFRLREETLRHRTVTAGIHLARRDGTPLAGAEVSVEQLSHHFLFGCNLFAYGAFDADEDQQRYLESFGKLFNLAVVPMYWTLIEPVEGQPDYVRDTRGLPGPEPMVQWCRSHGLKVRGTPLLMNDVRPAWLRTQSGEEAARLVEAHVREVVGRFKGRVDYWDVAAEVWPTLAYGQLRLPVAYAFRWAHEADPQAALLLSHSAAHALVGAQRLNERQPFGLAGCVLAAYQAEGAWPAEELDAQLDRLARDKIAIHVGQVMIPGPARDEELQARQVEEFYRTAFAHPSVRSITWWDLSDRFAHRGAPGGLLRKDLTPKPAYQALARLIRDQWWTSASGRTDEGGQFAFRGFFGRYRVRVTPADGPAAVWDVHLAPDGQEDVSLLYPPEFGEGEGEE